MARRMLIFGTGFLIGNFYLMILGFLGKPQSKISLRPAPSAPGLAKINHIVFLIKENRTFDTYFGTFPGADGVTSGKTSTGEVVKLGHTPDSTPYDLGHRGQDLLKAVDDGKMDRFDQIWNGNVSGYLLPYTQMTESDIRQLLCVRTEFRAVGRHVLFSRRTEFS